MSKTNFNKYLKHLPIWSLVFILYYSFNQAQCTPFLLFVFTLFILICDIITYYFIRFFVYPRAELGKYFQVFIGYVLAYCIYFCIDFINYKFVFPNLNINHVRSKVDILEFIKRDLKWYFELFTIAYAGMLSRIGLAKTKQVNQIIEFRINNELSLLKNQFHSHLSFNFFNFCYIKLNKLSTSVAQLVEYYSGMLYYTLNVSQSSKIELQAEIDYLNNLIAVHKYLSDDVYCIFDVSNIKQSYIIKPMIFGVLLEFAFKYGQFDTISEPIKVSLNQIENRIEFQIAYFRDSKYNSKFLDETQFQQLKRYLEIHYKSRFVLIHNLPLGGMQNIYLKLELNGTDKI